METIINDKVPESHKQEWRNAARQWRLPYWDFAKPSIPHPTGRLSLPTLCKKATVVILDPKNPGSSIKRPNPVYKYEAPKLMGDLDNPFNIPPERIDPKEDDYYPVCLEVFYRMSFTLTEQSGINVGRRPSMGF
jgi:tyrosinase